MHRAILGSFERFLGILIEHTGGQLPVLDRARAGGRAARLGPVRREGPRSRGAARRRPACGSRCDDKNEKLGARIRKAELMKVPCMLVVGEKEAAAGSVAVRLRHGGDAGTMPDRRVPIGRAGRGRVEATGVSSEVKDR